MKSANIVMRRNLDRLSDGWRGSRLNQKGVAEETFARANYSSVKGGTVCSISDTDFLRHHDWPARF